MPGPKMPLLPTAIARLSQEQFAKLAAQLPKMGCPKDGTEAAYLLGVQTVLTKLRDGWVIEYQ
jgi:hypothetical protein